MNGLYAKVRASMQPRNYSLRGKITFLFIFYFAQGLPVGLQSICLPLFLRSVTKTSLPAISITTGILALPWMLKWIWAPLVDVYGGRGKRRPWLLATQLGQLICACGAAYTMPSPESGVTTTLSIGPFLAILFLMKLLAATQDIAVDGLAVDFLGDSPASLGIGNTAQVVGFKTGMLCGGGLLLWLSTKLGGGWPGVFIGLAVLISIALGAAWALQEERDVCYEEEDHEPDELAYVIQHSPARKPRSDNVTTFGAVIAALSTSISSRSGVKLLFLCATYKSGEALIDAMYKPFLVDAGVATDRIGLWLGTYSMLFSLIGSAVAGAMLSKVRIAPFLCVAAMLRLVPLTGEFLLAAITPIPPTVPPSGVVVVTIAALESALGGMLTTAVYAAMMAGVDSRIGATHVTVLASVEAIGKAPFVWSAGIIANTAGYTWLFGIGVLLSALYAVAALWIAEGACIPTTHRD